MIARMGEGWPMREGRGDTGLGKQDSVAGRYRLHEVLGRGGMGTVWRATDELLGRTVAVKQLALDALPPADARVARERAMREARIAASVHHPNIVSIFDVVLEAGVPWLVMEYVPARSLGSILDEHGPLPPADVAAIGAQIAAAVAAAHAAGIVHRDITPGNVLIDDATGTAKISDFGVSHAVTAPTVTGTGVLTGTPAYFAPETARGEGTDARTDVYSLGATLYAAVEGHPPFGTDPDNVLALLSRIGGGGVPAPTRAGPLTPVLQRLTADNPAARPTAAEAHAELAGLADALTPGASGPAPAPRPGRRRRLGLLGVAAVLVVAALAVTIQWIGSEPAARPTPPPPLAILDEHGADPCSLLDTAALARFGPATIRPGYGPFSECVATFPVTESDEVHVEVELRNGAETVGDVDAARRDPQNPVVVPVAQDDGFCHRYVLLPDTHVISVAAVRYGYGETDRTDYCAVADTAADAVVARLARAGLLPRGSVDDRSALHEIRACDLLDQNAVAATATPTGKPPAGGPTDGYAGWSCDWAPVWLDYTREASPGTPEFYGEPVAIGGRTGMTRSDTVSDSATSCRAYIPQRQFTAADGTAKTEYVRVIVDGSADLATICRATVGLAERIVAKLPPQS
jgi:hypothetical protein